MDQSVNIKEIALDQFKNIDKSDIEFVSLKDGSLAHVINEKNEISKRNEEEITSFIKIGEKQYEYETQLEASPLKNQLENNKIDNSQENENSPNKKTIESNDNEYSDGNIVEERRNYRLFESGAGYIDKNYLGNDKRLSVINEIDEKNYRTDNENNLNNFQTNKIKLTGQQKGIFKSESPTSQKIQFYRVINFSKKINDNTKNVIESNNLNNYINNNIDNNTDSINKSIDVDKESNQMIYSLRDDTFEQDNTLDEKLNNNCPSKSGLIKEGSHLDDFRKSNSMKVIIETKKSKNNLLKRQSGFLDNFGYLEVKGVSPKLPKKYS